MTGEESYGESHEMRWSWRNNAMVVQISSLYMIDVKDDHSHGARQCRLEQETHFIFCKF